MKPYDQWSEEEMSEMAEVWDALQTLVDGGVTPEQYRQMFDALSPSKEEAND